MRIKALETQTQSGTSCLQAHEPESEELTKLPKQDAADEILKDLKDESLQIIDLEKLINEQGNGQKGAD